MTLQSAQAGGAPPGRIDLPPGFTAVALRELGDAFQHAMGVAGERGAGTLVWVRRYDVVELAVVLEPDEPLAGARRVLYAAMNAIGDALAAHAPPEKPVAFVWPDTILVDGGIVGGARLGWPAGCTAAAVPDWLVVGLLLRAVTPQLGGKATATAHPLDEMARRGTSLASEGFEMLDAAALIASFARHLMMHVDQWQANGFKPVGQNWLARLARDQGVRHGIDGNGDLLSRRLADPQAVERRSLVATLAQPGWLDPATGEPWL